MAFFLWIFLAIVLFLSILTGFFFLEVVTAFRIRTKNPPPITAGSPALCIVVPAHNEEAVIAANLARLCAQVDDPDHILVVADNCTDNTAEIARRCGVRVIERQHDTERGKGYALHYALRYLEQQSMLPAVVVIVDADCYVAAGDIRTMANACLAQQVPLQAVYLMEPPTDTPSLKMRIATFAFRVKNMVRLLGATQLGIPCVLTGSGMAFPWATIQKMQLASGNLVEDMQMSIDLAKQGNPARIYTGVRVISPFPEATHTLENQKKRWEHGHLTTIRKQSIPLLVAAVQQRCWPLALMAVEIMIPPLTLLLALVAATSIAGGVMAALYASFAVLWLSIIPLLLLSAAVYLAWYGFCRDIITLKQMLMIPQYMLSKASLYSSWLKKPESTWVKTKRK